jgi:hypothetical protein
MDERLVIAERKGLVSGKIAREARSFLRRAVMPVALQREIGDNAGFGRGCVSSAYRCLLTLAAARYIGL